MAVPPSNRLRRCAEAAFVLGILLLSLATSLMAKAGLGMSMVVAPAYVLADWLGLPSGTTCYICQGLLVVATCLLVRRFRLSFLFTFLSAVFFGLMVNVYTSLFSFLQAPLLWQRILLFVLALPLNCLAISLLFHTYFPPQAPELFVKEFSKRFQRPLHHCKYAYDIVSCLLAVILSLLLLGRLRYIGAGTFICTLVNGPLIGFLGRVLDKNFGFEPMLPGIAAFFEKS